MAPDPVGPTVSYLVVSKNPALLNRLLSSLSCARAFPQAGDEVLCSWNGSSSDEDLLVNHGPPGFRIACRRPYHFASNMNALAEQATGEFLVFINDDLVLDPGSIDRAVQVLLSRPEVGMVGGRLRSSTGLLTHAGLLFSNDHLPYNRFRPEQLGALIDPDALEVQESGPMPAVTGALMVMRRSDFLTVRFRETFRVCGEDIALCLDFWTSLEKTPYYSADVTAVHDEKSTRGNTLDTYDIRQVGILVEQVTRDSPRLRASFTYWAVQEADLMWRLAIRQRERSVEMKVEMEAEHNLQLETQQHGFADHCERLNWELSVVREELRSVQDQLEESQQAIDDLLNSRSWKLTATYRQLGQFLERFRRSS